MHSQVQAAHYVKSDDVDDDMENVILVGLVGSCFSRRSCCGL